MNIATASNEAAPYAPEVPGDVWSRLARIQWPDRKTRDDWSQGIPLSYVEELRGYWASKYDSRRCKAALNGLGTTGSGSKAAGQSRSASISCTSARRTMTRFRSCCPTRWPGS